MQALDRNGLCPMDRKDVIESEIIMPQYSVPGKYLKKFCANQNGVQNEKIRKSRNSLQGCLRMRKGTTSPSDANSLKKSLGEKRWAKR